MGDRDDLPPKDHSPKRKAVETDRRRPAARRKTSPSGQAETTARSPKPASAVASSTASSTRTARSTKAGAGERAVKGNQQRSAEPARDTSTSDGQVQRPTARRVRRKARAASPPVHNGSEARDSVTPSDAARNDSGAPRSEGEQRVEAFERDLGKLIDALDPTAPDPAARRRAAAAIGEIAHRLDTAGSFSARPRQERLHAAREMLSTDYYLRQWGRLGMRYRSAEVDPFGLDTAYEARVRPMLEFLCRRYFRTEVIGLEHIPADGRALLVANHGGALPWDGVMLRTAVRAMHPEQRDVRWLVEDFVFHFPFLGAFVNRIGAVRACQENAERLLSEERLVAVFPEGIKGVGKTYAERYQLQRFGRGGYVKLALRTGAPVLPVAIVGPEETHPLLFKTQFLAKLFHVPFLPITPTFPWLGPLGLLPLPSRWRIVIGPPVQELQALPPEAAEDTLLVNRWNERIRGTLQEMVATAVSERGSQFVR